MGPLKDKVRIVHEAGTGIVHMGVVPSLENKTVGLSLRKRTVREAT